MHPIRTIAFYLLFVFNVNNTSAQPYKLRIVKKSETGLGIELFIDPDHPLTARDYVMDLVFGIKWTNGQHTDLGNTIQSRFHVHPSGVPVKKDSFFYQAFYIDTIGFLPRWLNTGSWIEIMSVNAVVDAPGTSSFQLCEPGFATTTEPNITISQTDHTPGTLGVARLSARQENGPRRQNDFFIRPNPTYGMLELGWSGKCGAVRRLRYRVVDIKGVLLREGWFDCDENGLVSLDLAFLGRGQYYLVVDSGDEVIFRNPFQKL